MPKVKDTTPRKPRPDFPLFPHARGYWCKKVRGKLHYFGKVKDDPDGKAALESWLANRDALLAGREPQLNPRGATIKQLVNGFLTHKTSLLQSGEIVERTFNEYHATCERLVKAFGRTTAVDFLVADDFRRLRTQIARQWGPIRLSNEIQRVRSIFKYGYEAGLLDKPVRFGPDFKKPAAKVMRLNRAKAGLRMFESAELRQMLAVATPNVKAMMLLACNGGLGNGDVAGLTFKAVDLKTGWITYPRPKTGVERRIPLWKETIDAIKAAIKQRPQPKDPSNKALLFIGRRGESYLCGNGYRVAQEFERTRTAAKVEPRRGFYCIRHTFQTIGEGANDLVSVQKIMGHAPSGADMSAQYRERIDDTRLVAVTEHVRQWLFASEKNK